MHVWKMNGAGNDFLILDDRQEDLTEQRISMLATKLCERHLSLGADGLMVVRKPKMGGDLQMLFYNADGSKGEMCGNGARCICRYAHEIGVAGDTQRIETTAGMVTGWKVNRREYRIEINQPTVFRLELPVQLDGIQLACSYLELGNPGLPHVVLPYHALRNAPEEELRQIGKKLRSHPEFPKGANVNFYDVEGPDQVWVRTYERGVEDFTYACGTGSCSVAAVLTLQGRRDGNGIKLQMVGGTLVVDVQRVGETVTHLYLTGPTNIVSNSEVTDQELEL